MLLGGHPAIDFMNTHFVPGGVATELLGDGRAYLDWLIAAGLVEPRRYAGLDEAAAEVRRFRERARGWLARWREDGRFLDAGELNRLMARAPVERQLIDGELVERPKLDDARALLGVVALQIARLVTAEDHTRLKACAGEDCTLWFLDRSKAGARRFCSAATCGNRAKVAAFRARQR